MRSDLAYVAFPKLTILYFIVFNQIVYASSGFYTAAKIYFVSLINEVVSFLRTSIRYLQPMKLAGAS